MSKDFAIICIAKSNENKCKSFWEIERIGFQKSVVSYNFFSEINPIHCNRIQLSKYTILTTIVISEVTSNEKI